MVTVDFVKGAAVTFLAIGGMLVGFRVQDAMRRRLEVRAFGWCVTVSLGRAAAPPCADPPAWIMQADIDRAVEEEYQRRLAARAATRALPASASPVGAAVSTDPTTRAPS